MTAVCCEVMRLAVAGSRSSPVGFTEALITKATAGSRPVYRYRIGHGRYANAILVCCPFCRAPLGGALQ